jgi:hypothetical protein
MSANEPLMKHRKDLRRHQNRSFPRALGAAWQMPTYWPCGVRCSGGMTLIRAFGRQVQLFRYVGDEPRQVPFGKPLLQ